MLESKSMKIVDFKKDRVSELAEQLLSKAKENEASITEDIEIIALTIGAKLIGLENKFKTKKSLLRKLTDKNAATKIPIQKIAKRINDVLRYTYLLEEDEYADKLQAVQVFLEAKDYVVRKILNAWEFEQTVSDTGYRGVNMTVISSQHQVFELQLHTKASFRLKTENHGLYEEFRNPQTSEKRKIEIAEIIKEKAGKLKRPRGI
jgi:negative regulator of replication initiation